MNFKKIAILSLGTLALLAGGSFLSQYLAQTQAGSGEGALISARAIHYHPRLSINIKGEPFPIPGGIGATGRHFPIHTHEGDGTLHLELNGPVREDDIRLGRFFEIWGKTFNREQIFEYRNGESGTVRMLVNGEENDEFENYVMQNGDQIEIRYE